MLHDELKHYLDAVEQAVLGCDGIYVERYTEEILSYLKQIFENSLSTNTNK